MTDRRHRRLVLASSSEARLRLLRLAGIDPEVVVSGVDESAEGSATEVAVAILAERKAEAVASRLPESLVLGCDSLLDLEGTTFTKPSTVEEIEKMWSRMSGRTGTLYTGHCLIGPPAGRLSEVASTRVRFGQPTSEEIAAYAASGEPMALAGAFSIDGLGAPFVDGIDGDASNVLGLSLPLLRRMLAKLGVGIVDLWRTRVTPTLRPAAPADRQMISDLVEAEWGLPVVSISGIHNPGTLPAILAEQDGELLGVLTYRVSDSDMEVVTLNSIVEDRGVGSALLAEARRMAEQARRRLWLITTNENLRAIGFYQRRGMHMVGLHRDFADEVRAAKPGEEERGAATGAGAGPGAGAATGARLAFRHAIEFEYPRY